MFDTAMIFDAALLPAMLVAMMAGLLSFLSPCVLPIVPPYLAYMGGVSVSEMEAARHARRRAIPPIPTGLSANRWRRESTPQ